MSVLIQDRDFDGVARAATEAIQRGETILSWWNSIPPLTMTHLPGSRPDTCMQHFFCTLSIDGVFTSANGCFQTSKFARRAAKDQPAVSLAEWVSTNFLQKCRWTNSNGTRSGFLYRPVLVLDQCGSSGVRRVDENLDLRLGEVGSRYSWAAVRLDVLDYMRAFPVIGNFSRLLKPLNREAGYMVLHPHYFQSKHPSPDGCIEEYCFGYSVAPWKVLPTIAAYGPGRFHSAFKQFRFCLLQDGTVAIQVLFVVVPRCERVLDILGIDPYFDTVRLMDVLTLGQTHIVEFAHVGVDLYAIGHHARVHNNLLSGMRRIWEGTNWQPATGQSASSSASGR